MYVIYNPGTIFRGLCIYVQSLPRRMGVVVSATLAGKIVFDAALPKRPSEGERKPERRWGFGQVGLVPLKMRKVARCCDSHLLVPAAHPLEITWHNSH